MSHPKLSPVVLTVELNETIQRFRQEHPEILLSAFIREAIVAKLREYGYEVTDVHPERGGDKSD